MQDLTYMTNNSSQLAVSNGDAYLAAVSNSDAYFAKIQYGGEHEEKALARLLSTVSYSYQ